MRKLHVVGLVLCGIFAFCAIAASAALAVPTWLVDGAVPAANTPAVTEGEVELKNYNDSTLSELLNILLCSGIFVGEIKAGGTETVVNSVETLSHTAVGEDHENSLVGTALLCEVTFKAGALTDCKVGANEAEVYPANLPWKLTLELMTNGTILALFPAKSGYEVVCKSLLGVNGENLCEGAVNVLLENHLEHVLGTFEEQLHPNLATCSLTGVDTGEVRGAGETYALEAGTLTLLATSISGE